MEYLQDTIPGGKGLVWEGDMEGCPWPAGPQAGAPGITSPLNQGPSGWGMEVGTRTLTGSRAVEKRVRECRVPRATRGRRPRGPPLVLPRNESPFPGSHSGLACSRAPQRSPLLLPVRTPAPRVGLPLPTVLLRLLCSLCPTHCSVGPRRQGPSGGGGGRISQPPQQVGLWPGVGLGRGGA